MERTAYNHRGFDMRLLMMVTGLTILVLNSTNLTAEEVYKWVDANGVTHYQAHPPKNREVTTIQTKTGHSAPVKYNTKTGKVVAQKDTDSAPIVTSKKDPELCLKAQDNLKALQQYSRVRVADENGELRYLEPDEIEQRKQNANRVMGEAC